MPSKDLSREIDELNELIKEMLEKKGKSPNSLKINILGKSLGGVIALNLCRFLMRRYINKIIVLGFPFLLGNPPRLNLLKEEAPLPNYNLEYYLLFNDLRRVKVNILQGLKDDLCQVDKLEKITKRYSNIRLIKFKNADHDFSCYKKNNFKPVLTAINHCLIDSF
jgi:predicted alpha/beta-hydrolase family hydrolase